MDEILGMIDENFDDNIIVDLIDSIPSDKLNQLFEDERVQKYRGLYSNILESQDFNHTFDTMEEVSVDKIKVDKDLLKLLKLKKKDIYFEDLMLKFDEYVKDKGLNDGINQDILTVFEDELKYLNYKKLNEFRRGMLIVSKIESNI